jgi:PPP family 3-phenylpropionic acid transporter
MVLQSTRWLALGYFTYFFSYGIFLPFWSVWLKGIGLTPETIGLLLGAGLVARFLGSLLIAPRVSDPSRLIFALRVLALLTLLFAVAFWAGAHVAWLMLVMIGFNLFFSPLVPLTDALANTWQKQFPLDYGKVRLWGSVAFVIGSALTGKLVTMFDYRVILALLTLGVASMLLGFLIRPTIQPQGASRQQESTGWSAWLALVRQNWRFLACVCLLQGAHAAYYGFSAIYWQAAGYSVGRDNIHQQRIERDLQDRIADPQQCECGQYQWETVIEQRQQHGNGRNGSTQQYCVLTPEAAHEDTRRQRDNRKPEKDQQRNQIGPRIVQCKVLFDVVGRYVDDIDETHHEKAEKHGRQLGKVQFFAHKNQVSETAAAGCQLYGNSKLWIFRQGSAHTYEKIRENPLRDAIPHRQKELRRTAPTPRK